MMVAMTDAERALMPFAWATLAGGMVWLVGSLWWDAYRQERRDRFDELRRQASDDADLWVELLTDDGRPLGPREKAPPAGEALTLSVPELYDWAIEGG